MSLAGLKARCPKFGCGTLADVPAVIEAEAVEVVEPQPLPPPAPPKQAPPKPPPFPIVKAEIIEEEDYQEEEAEKSTRRGRTTARRHDDDEPEDRPRRSRRRYEDDDSPIERRPRRRKKAKRGGIGPGVIVACILGGLVVLGGAGFGIYALVSSSGIGKASPPKGWKQFSYPDSGFRAYFPREPIKFGGGQGPLGGGFGFGQFQGAASGGAVYTVFGENEPVQIVVAEYKFAPSGDGQDRLEKLMQAQMEQAAREKNGQSRKLRWLGATAFEATSSEGTIRVAITNSRLILAAVMGRNGGRASSADEDGFFDNFELIK